MKKTERVKVTHSKFLKEHLSTAGIGTETGRISKIIFYVCIALNLLFSLYLMYFFIANKGFPILYILVLVLLLWTLAFFMLLFILWLLFYIFLDFRIFKRKMSIEEVLPDFLHLTATNIRAGMPIDKALWFAVRPRFGVLAKEIETVAKEVMSGSELNDSLMNFANKYRSNVLRRSISLLIEGISAGGEIGNLLTKIASHIEEVKIMKKEMSANVTTYVIFITFAAIIAAPVLLALSSQLLSIINDIFSRIDIPSNTQMMFSITESAVEPADFKTFSILILFITAFFSAMIVAIIKKGNVVEGLKYIPTFVVVSLLMYFISLSLLGVVMGGIF